ncbi:MAG: hypothetical protein ACYSW8_31355 [Planctomycetota bacterium]
MKKPLVITDGQIERLQSGDRLDLSNSVNKNNNTGNTLNIAQPVYVNGVNIALAQADAQSTVRVAGLMQADTTNNAAGDVITGGVFEATTGEWDTVTGESGGLTAGADYFLSAATAGELTQNAPNSAGEFVVPVGHALSTTEFEIEIQPAIKL